jgi:hypothetical protein
MAATYEPIATTTLGSAQTTVTFNSFSGYTDLICVAVPKISGATAYNLNGYFNTDYTGTNYSATRLIGYGTSGKASDRLTNYPVLLLSGEAKVPTTNDANFIIQIMNYSNSSTYKTVLSRSNNATASAVDAIVNTWRSTAAITSFTLNPDGAAQFASGSTFTLYGVKSA